MPGHAQMSLLFIPRRAKPEEFPRVPCTLETYPARHDERTGKASVGERGEREKSASILFVICHLTSISEERSGIDSSIFFTNG